MLREEAALKVALEVRERCREGKSAVCTRVSGRSGSRRGVNGVRKRSRRRCATIIRSASASMLRWRDSASCSASDSAGRVRVELFVTDGDRLVACEAAVRKERAVAQEAVLLLASVLPRRTAASSSARLLLIIIVHLCTTSLP